MAQPGSHRIRIAALTVVALAACQHEAPPPSPWASVARLQPAPPLVLAQAPLAEEAATQAEFVESLRLVAGDQAARQILTDLAVALRNAGDARHLAAVQALLAQLPAETP